MNIPATVIAWLALAVSVIAGIVAVAGGGGHDSSETVSRQVAELAAKVEAVEPFDAGPLEKQLAQLTAKLEAVESFDPVPLKARLDEFASRLADLPTPFDPAPLEARLDNLSGKLATLQAPEPFDPAPLETRIEEIGSKIAALAALEPFDAAPLQSRIDDLAAKLAAAIAADPAAMQDRVDDLAARIAELKTFDPAPLQARVEALDVAVSRNATSAGVGTQRLLGQVYFDTNRSDLTDEATAKLARWAQELAGKPHRLAILGFADRVGRPDYNVNLSIRRAAAVRSYLLRNGLDDGSIVVSAGGYGEEGAPVPTDDDVDEPQNRTVHVYVYE